ncbi:UNVERIFIED_CONTAM: hypothetical protein NCL1_20144 [Trichonephila clavipes]
MEKKNRLAVFTTLPLLVEHTRITSSFTFPTGLSNSSLNNLCPGRKNSECSVLIRASLIRPSRPGNKFVFIQLTGVVFLIIVLLSTLILLQKIPNSNVIVL